jgi:hypothetical protein
MRYTITALASDEQTLALMRQNLLAVGAPRADIIVRAGNSGVSQPQVSIATSDLAASEVYHDVLELAGGVLVKSSEESSVHEAVR